MNSLREFLADFFAGVTQEHFNSSLDGHLCRGGDGRYVVECEPVRLFAGMLCRNEAWIVGLSARAALQWVDNLIILDHCSTDDSWEIACDVAEEFPGRVTILQERDPVWYEMRFRQRMLSEAREGGMTHFATVDADEVLSANLIPQIRGLVERTPMGQILVPPWVCLARGVERFYASGVWYNNVVSMAFPDAPHLHWEPQGDEKYDFHHRHPMGNPYRPFMPISQKLDAHQGGLLHFQFVDERRLKAKQLKYKLDELIRWPGKRSVQELNKMYGRAIYESDPAAVATAPVDPAWLAPYNDLMRQHFHPEAEPWQESICQQLVIQHPGIERGLDTFGVLAG